MRSHYSDVSRDAALTQQTAKEFTDLVATHAPKEIPDVVKTPGALTRDTSVRLLQEAEIRTLELGGVTSIRFMERIGERTYKRVPVVQFLGNAALGSNGEGELDVLASVIAQSPDLYVVEFPEVSEGMSVVRAGQLLSEIAVAMMPTRAPHEN